jgi:hypothetical protein
VSQVLADIAPAPITPELDMVPAYRVDEALDRLVGGTAERRVLLDLTRLR